MCVYVWGGYLSTRFRPICKHWSTIFSSSRISIGSLVSLRFVKFILVGPFQYAIFDTNNLFCFWGGAISKVVEFEFFTYGRDYYFKTPIYKRRDVYNCPMSSTNPRPVYVTATFKCCRVRVTTTIRVTAIEMSCPSRTRRGPYVRNGIPLSPYRFRNFTVAV